MGLKIYMTVGVREIGCRDWDLAISLITAYFKDKEDFLSFKNVDGKTVVTNGNDGHLVTVDKLLFNTDNVWAVYGDDGDNQYYTFMLPSEY